MSVYRRLSEARAAVLEDAVDTFVGLAKRHADVHAVYVFGSAGTRRVGPKSDLDILVVRASFGGGDEGRQVDLLGGRFRPITAAWTVRN